MNPWELENKKAYKWRVACTKARADYAAQVLNPNTVSEAASKAAAEGYQLVRVRIEKPLDLRETAAAKELTKTLDGEGLTVGWEPRSVMARESPNGCDCVAYDLIVSW
jgi:hypothetical protein